MDAIFAEGMEDEKKIAHLINIYYKAHVWMLGWIKKGPNAVKEFMLNEKEITALEISCGEILSLLIANDTTSPWVRDTEYYDYMTPDGKIKRAKPGEDIAGIQVMFLHLKSDPGSIPYTKFLEVFINTCERLDIAYATQLFRINKVTFETPMSFVTFVVNSGLEISTIQLELHDWYVARLFFLGMLEKSKMSGSPKTTGKNNILSKFTRKMLIAYLRDNLLSFDPNDPRLRWLKISRKEMSEILGSAMRTIRKWDKNESAPGNLYWPAPEKADNGHCYYLVSKYLSSMQQLQWKKPEAA